MSTAPRDSRLVDCHFHWYPSEVEAGLKPAHGIPRRHSADWSDLEGHTGGMDVGVRGGVVAGRAARAERTPPSVSFAGLFPPGSPRGEPLRLTRLYNDLVA